MSAKPSEIFSQFVDAIVTERAPAKSPIGRSRIGYQWTDYGNVSFTGEVTYNYETDGDADEFGRYYDCSTIELCTCRVTHINGKHLGVNEFDCDPNDIPGFDVLEDTIREYETQPEWRK